MSLKPRTNKTRGKLQKRNVERRTKNPNRSAQAIHKLNKEIDACKKKITQNNETDRTLIASGYFAGRSQFHQDTEERKVMMLVMEELLKDIGAFADDVHGAVDIGMVNRNQIEVLAQSPVTKVKPIATQRWPWSTTFERGNGWTVVSIPMTMETF